MLRRSTPSSAQLTGGDLSVDILHTEDSVNLGDGTNLIGAFPEVGGLRSLPVANSTFATNSTLTGGSARSKITDGTDNVEIDDVGGEKALKVSVIASVGGGGGGTAATDSAAYTAGASQGTPAMGAYDDASSDALAEGEMGIIRVTSGRAMHVAVQNSVAVTGTFWQATQPVSGTVAVTDLSTLATHAKQDTIIGHLDGVEGLLGTIDTDTGNIATSLAILDDWDATAGSAHPSDGVMVMGSDGTNARRLTTDSSGDLQVDVKTMPTVAVTGTFWQATQPVSGTFWQATQPVSIAAAVAVTDNGGSLTVDGTVGVSGSVAVTGTFWQATQPVSGTVTASSVTGNVAHDAAASGNPVLIAGRANNANPTEVAAGDSSYIMTDLSGKVVVTFSPRALVAQATGSQATTTEATMLAAGGAGVFHDITQLILTNSNTTTAAQVQIRDATAGTIRFEHVIPAASGMVINFPVPLVQTTANNNWTIDLNSAVSTVYYTVQAVKRT